MKRAYAVSSSEKTNANIEELVKNRIPDGWNYQQVHHQRLGQGERFSFRAEKNDIFSVDHDRVGVYITQYNDGRQVVACQDEDSLTKEYEAVRHSMESTRKVHSINEQTRFLAKTILPIEVGLLYCVRLFACVAFFSPKNALQTAN